MNGRHAKTKTVWNVGGIIEKMSERQHRMEEKYFNRNIKQNAGNSANVGGVKSRADAENQQGGQVSKLHLATPGLEYTLRRQDQNQVPPEQRVVSGRPAISEHPSVASNPKFLRQRGKTNIRNCRYGLIGGPYSSKPKIHESRYLRQRDVGSPHPVSGRKKGQQSRAVPESAQVARKGGPNQGQKFVRKGGRAAVYGVRTPAKNEGPPPEQTSNRDLSTESKFNTIDQNGISFANSEGTSEFLNICEVEPAFAEGDQEQRLAGFNHGLIHMPRNTAYDHFLGQFITGEEDDEDEIEESIHEDCADSQSQSGSCSSDCEPHTSEEDSLDARPAGRDAEKSTKVLQVIKNISHIATPNTISSNAEKLKRGVSRDSEMHFNNGTMMNFGLATQSTRSTSMKTPLMFAQNTHAKLRDINN